jgi:hypothetical protein
VATLAAYLDHYGKLTNSEEQAEISYNFGCYLLSTSWKKIWRRITSWQTMGFIRALNRVDMNDFEDSLEDHKFSSMTGIGDKSLDDILSHKEFTDTVAHLFFSHIPPEHTPHIQAFLSGFRPPDKRKPPFFSKKTALGFHRFTIATFQGLARSLMQLSDIDSKLVGGIFQPRYYI